MKFWAFLAKNITLKPASQYFHVCKKLNVSYTPKCHNIHTNMAIGVYIVTFWCAGHIKFFIVIGCIS